VKIEAMCEKAFNLNQKSMKLINGHGLFGSLLVLKNRYKNP
jgi:hypothetical protein